jgi:rRNA methylase
MLRLVIVSPKYQMNVGYIARIAKNFGIEKLHIVKPRANIVGKKQ